MAGDVGRARSAAYLAACGAVIGFALGYALPGYARLPNLVYDPIGRRFYVAVHVGAVPMAYYGLLLYGAAGAAIVGGLAALFGRGRALSDRGAALLAAWALTALALVLAFLAWNNWP